MKKQIIRLFFLAPMCLSIFACSKQQQEQQESEKPFEQSMDATLVAEQDYIQHDGGQNHRWQYDQEMWYINNLDKVPLPDPQVYVEDGTYYIVGTDDGSSCRQVTCYYTTNFVDFETKAIFKPASFNGRWEKSENATVYAPEMYKFGDKYYLYYSALDSSSVRYNSVVWADSPLGPYEPIVTGDVDGLHNPLLKAPDSASELDATVFVDDNNQMYMYYSWSKNGRQAVYGVKLNSPYQADWTTRKLLVEPGTLDSESSEYVLGWERYRSYPICEGPFMLKNNGKYYLTYSANGCWDKFYNVCYTVCDTPLGNFVKPYNTEDIWTNLLMGVPCEEDINSTVFKQWTGFAAGTGHHCFFKIGDQLMIGYHALKGRKADTANPGWQARYFAMEPVYFLDDGTPYINGPSWSPQPLPYELSGMRNVALNATVRTQNVKNEKNINDNYIVDCYNLKSEANKEVGLGVGYSFIELKLDKEYTIKGLAVYNSAHYEKSTPAIKYIAFSNGDVIGRSEFPINYLDGETEFAYPLSAFSYEFSKEIKADSIIFAFNYGEEVSINEIAVLAK